MNVDEIRKWHNVFKREDELFEIRLLGDRTWSGYFYDVEQAIEKLQPFDNLNIYFSVNEVKRACASRSQFGSFQQVKGTATSKQDIEHRWWLPIDVDCERPSGVSSTDEEKVFAHNKAADVYRFLKSNDFSEPIVCDSSSGYHIFIPIDMDNTQESEQTIKTFLEILGSHFTDNHVKIDNVLFDANRIIRLPGSFGRKGLSTEERPHRQAKILSVPREIVRVGKDFIDSFNARYKVVTEQPERRYGNYSNVVHEEFNLRKFISENGISVSKEIPMSGGGTKFVLTECIFDSGHKAPDAAIFEMPNGAIAYKCFHQSCACHDWRDVRIKFAPHAYDQKPQQQYQRTYQPQQRAAQQPPQQEIKPETAELGKKWFSMKNIQKINLGDIEHFKTGFTELDRMIRGLFVGELTIVSGTNSSGKSSWLNTLMLNVVQQGWKVALWSGELRPDVLKTWIQMVAIGTDFLAKANNGYRYVTDELGAKVDEWLDGKFFLYNNEYGSRFEQIMSDMQELVAVGVRVFILDNLMTIDVDLFDGNSNRQQKDIISKIVEFNKKNKTHTILVAHPRKVSTLIRKNDISGSGDIGNAADNIFLIHRVNEDFRKAGTEYFGKPKMDSIIEAKYGNVLEVSKNRMMGVQDFLCGMYYELESRRFKNKPDEKRVYGWRDDIATQQDMFDVKEELPFEPPTDDAAPF